MFLLFGLKMQLYAVLICMYDTICGFVWSCIHLRQMGWKWLFQLFSHSSCFCMCTVLYYQKLCTIITGAKPSNLLIRSKKNYQVEISFIFDNRDKTYFNRMAMAMGSFGSGLFGQQIWVRIKLQLFKSSPNLGLVTFGRICTEGNTILELCSFTNLLSVTTH